MQQISVEVWEAGGIFRWGFPANGLRTEAAVPLPATPSDQLASTELMGLTAGRSLPTPAMAGFPSSSSSRRAVCLRRRRPQPRSLASARSPAWSHRCSAGASTPGTNAGSCDQPLRDLAVAGLLAAAGPVFAFPLAALRFLLSLLVYIPRRAHLRQRPGPVPATGQSALVLSRASVAASSAYPRARIGHGREHHLDGPDPPLTASTNRTSRPRWRDDR